MRFQRPLFLLPVVAAVLAGCGGSTDAPPPRATIVLAQLAGQATTAQIDAGTTATGLIGLTGAAVCNVDIRYVVYQTRDPAGQPATASTAAFVPSGTDASCTGSRPVVLYAHGTTIEKAYNMADITHNSEGSLVAALLAAHGYIVVAPNYLGYDESGLDYHPYLNAENSAIDMVDGLRAAKAYLNEASAVKPSAQLFVTGYSQGGHVAMATHKIIERDYASEFTVTASAPMSGPHNLAKFIAQINSGPDVCPTLGSSDPNCTVNAGATLFTPLLLTSWQRSYGDVYSDAASVYQLPYGAATATLLPTNSTAEELLTTGKLPADTTFRKLFGTGGLIQESYRASYFASGSGFAKAAAANTLLGWTPKAPMAMCYSAADPTVYAYNTTDMQADLASRGVLVPALDVRGDPATIAGTLGNSAAQLAGAFQVNNPAAGTAVGTPGTENDHAAAAPYCATFVRGFFANFVQ
ncbi:prolyl oligopeptidase family serine peptidase [Ideonella azotifigens]|uniref:Alpha/beta hydrolase n=1 Tax=Ideonella azotifigens TaxID=513160 RepID=A0ABN1KDB0_9BURK|nr:prolyl oligopeptidase family serine peptidase [Ideonella azotifigens]MCD2343666.1 prolyl oligopeptidase family serine peptidase [Ideonella azotifigens]